jgi:hypothetical protein
MVFFDSRRFEWRNISQFFPDRFIVSLVFVGENVSKMSEVEIITWLEEIAFSIIEIVP